MTPNEARAALESIQARAADARTYDAALVALGPRPAIPAAPDRPTDPESARPSEKAINHAHNVVNETRTAVALRDKATRDLADAQARATESNTARAHATVEAARVTRLVDALRKAPTIAAQKKRDRLGDLGAVDVLFHDPGAQGPVCTVTVNGRPWEVASRGERVVADAILRAAVRRESKVPMLPLVIDDVSAWNGGAGPWPTFAAPVLWLVTTDDDALTVREGTP